LQPQQTNIEEMSEEASEQLIVDGRGEEQEGGDDDDDDDDDDNQADEKYWRKLRSLTSTRQWPWQWN